MNQPQDRVDVAVDIELVQVEISRGWTGVRLVASSVVGSCSPIAHIM